MGYGTLTDWRTYAADRGDNAPTEATDAQAAAALLRAQDYIKYQYVKRFSDGYDESNVEEVEPAVYEAASKELAVPQFFTKTYTPADQKILTEVKGIKWTVVDSSDGRAYPIMTTIEAMLAPYMRRAVTGLVVS